MQILRALLSGILAAMLALTSVTMAVARGQDRMGMLVELCAGGSVETVALDQQGKPVGPHHVCPDCVMGVTSQLLPEAVQMLMPQGHTTLLQFVNVQTDALTRVAPLPSARGPPEPI